MICGLNCGNTTTANTTTNQSIRQRNIANVVGHVWPCSNKHLKYLHILSVTSLLTIVAVHPICDVTTIVTHPICDVMLYSMQRYWG